MEWSPKQASFLAHSTAFINIADGAVRSGKTHSALAAFAESCLKGPVGDMGVFGKTERTVRRNVVYPLMELLPGAVRHIQGSGELYIFGRRCHVLGANDAKSEEKVRGLTLAGGYWNEVALYPKEIVDQSIARSLSIEGAKWFGDTNPDSPFHWLLRDYLEAGHPSDYVKRWRFKLTDNPILPPKNVEMLKAIYGPGTLFYRRMIEGQWIAAEGSVYPMLDVEPGGAHVVAELPRWFERVIVGIDYATSTTTVFLAAGLFRGTWYVFAEWAHDAESAGRQLSDAEQSKAFRDWIEKLGVRPESIEVDPAASSFKKQLRDDGVSSLRDADNSVVDGIRVVSTALTTGLLKIHKDCEGLLMSMSNYSWDPVAQAKGEDKPIKKHDHHADALRYLMMRAQGRHLAKVYSF